ncbi:hypothetical protein KR054_009122 [Drosophila jambulina]|nr:hypothetical protein KR054_009122 [Drosophila jambulina]
MILQLSCHQLSLLFIIISLMKTQALNNILSELNKRLLISTKFLYCNHTDKLYNYEAKYLRDMPSMSLMILTQTFNATELQYNLGATNKLFVILADEEPPYEAFKLLNLQFQQAEYVIFLDNPVDITQDPKWLNFVRYLWQEAYVHVLFYTSYDQKLYHKIIFPKLKIEETDITNYINFRASFQNLYGYPVRVAAYNNVPRTMIYVNKMGKRIFAGFYMRFVRAFLAATNASFVPIRTPSNSPGNCTLALQNERVDLCADALAANPSAFTLTHGFRIASANVLVTHAKPLHSYRYLTAPFQLSVWLCLTTYVGLVVSFLSLIHFLGSGRWDFSRHLLEVFSSLLYSGFHLKRLQGKARYILFCVLFISGFVYSTEYLALLKSLLISEVFEKQINSFEALVESNITLLVDPYDKILFAKYNMPEILWSIVETVSFKTLLEHRNRFDQDYAYILFSDRMALYDYAQQFLKHPKLLRIPIDFGFLYSGIPMRKRWFLKHHMDRAWYWAFESGLTRKLASDADYEAVRVGYLDFLITEHQEARPLGLDYFVMPAIALGLGYSLALVSFVIEMTAWRISEFLNCKRRRETSLEMGTSSGGGDVDVD